MHPALLLIPLAAVGGSAAVLRARAIAKKTAPGAVVPIPGGKGTVLIPSSVGPGQSVPDVKITQLPPAIQAAINTPGAPPDQSFLNALAIGIASGDPGFNDPSRVAKSRNGLIFDPRASTLIPGLKAGDILAGDTCTFDVGAAGMQISSVPGGSSIMLVQQPGNSSLAGIFVDARVPEGTAVTIPLSSVTGITPG